MQNTMTKEQIEEKIIEIISDTIYPDVVKLSDRFYQDYGVDSLDLIEIIMRCESEFGVPIKDKDIGLIKTVQDLVNIINKIYDKHNN